MLTEGSDVNMYICGVVHTWKPRIKKLRLKFGFLICHFYEADRNCPSYFSCNIKTTLGWMFAPTIRRRPGECSPPAEESQPQVACRPGEWDRHFRYFHLCWPWRDWEGPQLVLAETSGSKTWSPPCVPCGYKYWRQRFLRLPHPTLSEINNPRDVTSADATSVSQRSSSLGMEQEPHLFLFGPVLTHDHIKQESNKRVEHSWKWRGTCLTDCAGSTEGADCTPHLYVCNGCTSICHMNLNRWLRINSAPTHFNNVTFSHVWNLMYKLHTVVTARRRCWCDLGLDTGSMFQVGVWVWCSPSSHIYVCTGLDCDFHYMFTISE